MAYLIYGKGPEDKAFKALDAKGCRVSKLGNAMSYATKEDAEERIASCGGMKEGCEYQIRKAK